MGGERLLSEGRELTARGLVAFAGLARVLESGFLERTRPWVQQLGLAFLAAACYLYGGMGEGDRA